ncbi:MAG TPA: hypothetical protein VFG68_09045 [Fimbriiglobus sp.]|nr:hypothetical protein [Fimbriiglobus sp.]
MSTPPSPNDLTRQQLDELDSLLQRMLSLPLSGPPEDAPPPAPLVDLPTPPGWRADGGAASVKLPHLVADPVAAAVPVAVAEPRAAEPQWGPDPLARYAPPAAGDRPFGPPTSETGLPPSAGGSAYQYSLPVPAPGGPLRGVDAPALPAGFRSLLAEAEAEADRPYPLAPIPAAPPPAPFPVSVETRPSLPIVLWPVVVVNWVLETLLGLFGPAGAALTRPAVKHLFGFTGVLLLAAAGLWTARGLGWVHFNLPWPR